MTKQQQRVSGDSGHSLMTPHRNMDTHTRQETTVTQAMKDAVVKELLERALDELDLMKASLNALEAAESAREARDGISASTPRPEDAHPKAHLRKKDLQVSHQVAHLGFLIAAVLAAFHRAGRTGSIDVLFMNALHKLRMLVDRVETADPHTLTKLHSGLTNVTLTSPGIPEDAMERLRNVLFEFELPHVRYPRTDHPHGQRVVVRMGERS
ncbi:MAG: hypothetical protein M1817_001514 [Caeruleum heppii]|nr:MAG: hypothetical protein M1817_001514 [Caeruleum heppii]